MSPRNKRARIRTTTIVAGIAVQSCPTITEHHSLNDLCILLVKSKKRNRWELPGGTHEQGESYERTLTRELWEELHIPPDALEFLDHRRVGKPRCYRRTHKPTPAGKQLKFVGFRVEILDTTLMKIDRRELADYLWVSINEIDSYRVNMSENAWEVVEQLRADHLLYR